MPVVFPTTRYINDLCDIWSYVATDSYEAADRLIARIEKRVDQLKDLPSMGERQPQLGEYVRRILVGKYCVFYETHNDELFVLRVIHSARDIKHLDIEN